MNPRLVARPCTSNHSGSPRYVFEPDLTPLESHPCASSRFNLFKITSLRKNRGRGGLQSQIGNRCSRLSSLLATFAPAQRDTLTSHCHPERSEGSAVFSRNARTSLVRNNATRHFSIFVSIATSLPRCFVTLARRNEDVSPKSEGSPLLSPHSHTFLRRATESLHISIQSRKPYPLFHSDRTARKNSPQRYKTSTKLRTRITIPFVTNMCRSFGPGPRSISFHSLLVCSQQRFSARILLRIHLHLRIHPHRHAPRFRYQPTTTSSHPDGGRPNLPLPFPNLSAPPNARSATRRSQAHKP
jgi:hypothetical protein